MLLTVADSNIVRAASADPFVASQGNANTNNETPPPPSAQPPTPPDAPQRSVEPGTITQGWDNSSFVPTEIAEHRDTVMQDSSNETSYETTFGNFVLNKSSPYFVRFLSPGPASREIAESAFLVLYQGLALLSPGNGTVDNATSRELSLQYGLYLSAARQGTMKVDYLFEREMNKITISFSPAVGLPDQYQIVWLTFTSWDALDTAYPADIEQRFEDLDGRYGGLFLGLDVGTLYATGTIEIPGAIIRPEKIAGSPGGPQLRMDVSDAATDFNGSYAGKLTFGGHSGNAVLSTFSKGRLVVDPTLLYSGKPQDATAFSSIERKTFYDGERYWIVWKDSSSAIKFKSSIDGRNWGIVQRAITTQGTLTYDFAVASYGKIVALLWIESNWPNSIRISTGQISADAIQWDNANGFTIPGGRGLYTDNTATSLNSPVGATFTSQGLQLAFTWTRSDGVVYKNPQFQRYTCTGQGSSGFSPCAVGTLSQYSNFGDGNSGTNFDHYLFPVAFADNSGTVAAVRVRSDTSNGWTDIIVAVFSHWRSKIPDRRNGARWGQRDRVSLLDGR